MGRLPAILRSALAWVLLLAETIVTWPIFVVAWLFSAAWFAIKGGYAIAQLASDDQKRAALRKMMGEK